MTYNIVAIDVGFGNVKYMHRRAQPIADGRPVLRKFEPKLFPALAVVAKDGDNSLASASKNHLNLVRVTSHGTSYWVGPDIHSQLKGGQESRTISNDYCLTKEYAACVYGVLAFEQINDVDVLVLGLPVSTWTAFKDRLVEAFEGKHQITPQFAVNIHKVLVVPQPMGGFYDAFNQHRSLGQQDDWKTTQTLIVDPGFNTLDWYLTQGQTPLQKQSGSRKDSGMRQVIEAVRDNLARQLSAILNDVVTPDELPASSIDSFIGGGMRAYQFGGPEYSADNGLDIASSKAAVSDAIRDAIRDMTTSIGNVNMIKRVILVGGGAALYKQEIELAFPRHAQSGYITTTEQPCFSNVIGYQIIGDKWAAQNAEAIAHRKAA